MTTEAPRRIGVWTIDPTHSLAEFAVKHLVITTIKGRFRDLAGTIEIDEGHPEYSSVEARIAVASIDTDLEDRDTHLRSDDFFNAEAYPYISFRSTRIERADDVRFTVTGDLTIRDVTKELELAVEYDGQVDDPWGGHRAAFTASTQISRSDFNVRFNPLMEAGGAVVGDSVKITLYIEAILQSPSLPGPPDRME
jgi:polyisoprenoid-binding protein YceI